MKKKKGKREGGGRGREKEIRGKKYLLNAS